MRGLMMVPAMVLVGLGAGDASAAVSVAIDLTRQRMHVESSSGSYDWPISSARSGFSTPRGSYAPTRLELMHYSKKYHMSPMPHAIFFRGGYAIHGTYSVGELGRPASHGCVRLAPGNASTLYRMVQNEGARISISGSPTGVTRVARRSRQVLGPSVPLRADRVRVARLAPVSRRSAVVPGYGDMPEVRRRIVRRPYRDFGYGRASGYGYAYQPVPYGYAPAYTYAPAYPSSPQIIYGAPGE